MSGLVNDERTSRWVARISPGRVESWLKQRRHERMLRAYGGLQTCPWCKQCAQEANASWRFDPYPEDMGLDILTCGVCEGRSLWLWGMGMHFIRSLDHPSMTPADIERERGDRI